MNGLGKANGISGISIVKLDDPLYEPTEAPVNTKLVLKPAAVPVYAPPLAPKL
ncbi:MAG: hypothetical protein RRY26_03370 [Cellulosilyticaceae bacterium]